MALPTNSQAPKGPGNAQGDARAGVNPWEVGLQTPTGFQAGAELRGPLALHLSEGDLEECEEWRWGAQRSGNRGLRSPGSL